jgi:hypothetical protein
MPSHALARRLLHKMELVCVCNSETTPTPNDTGGVAVRCEKKHIILAIPSFVLLVSTFLLKIVLGNFLFSTEEMFIYSDGIRLFLYCLSYKSETKQDVLHVPGIL